MLDIVMLRKLAQRYWWVGVAFVVLVGLMTMMGRKPSAEAEVNQPIVQTTIPMDGYMLTLPTWSNWSESVLEKGEGVNTINVSDEYAKDLTGKIWNTTVKDLQHDPKELGKQITTSLAGRGWSSLGAQVQRSDKGKFYAMKPTTVDDPKNGMDGLVWFDGTTIKLVSWSYSVTNYVEKRQNKKRADYSVFVSDPIEALAVLDAVRLRHRSGEGEALD